MARLYWQVRLNSPAVVGEESGYGFFVKTLTVITNPCNIQTKTTKPRLQFLFEIELTEKKNMLR